MAILLPKLRMYFAEFLNAGSSVRLCFLSLPTCVGLRYGPLQHILRDYFLARRLRALRLPVGSLPPGSAQAADLPPALSASPLRQGLPSPCRVSPYASSHRSCRRHGNVDPFPFAYGFRPRLRGRLTPGQIAFTLETSGFRRTGIRLPLPWKPQASGGRGSHPSFRYSCLHSLFHPVHGYSHIRFVLTWNAPLPTDFSVPKLR